MKAVSREILRTVIIAIVIFFALRATVNSSVVISGSMEPSLQIGERLLVSKVVYNFHEPRRGDIIVFKYPKDPEVEYIKRIIGLPGEIVEVTPDGVYIYQKDGNSLLLDEPYISEMASHPYRSNIIPESEYFVLGDNRNNSGDSRTGWTVPRENIIGKAWLSVWPPSEWGLAPNYPLPED